LVTIFGPFFCGWPTWPNSFFVGQSRGGQNGSN